MLCSIRMFSRCGLRSKMWPMWVRNSSSLDVVKKTFPAKGDMSDEEFFTAISRTVFESPRIQSVHIIMDKLAEEGNITFSNAFYNILDLRRRGMAVEALQISEWFESYNKNNVLSAEYHATKVDLIARVRGIFEAESYFHRVIVGVSSLSGNVLLAHFVRSNIVRKSIEMFQQISFSASTHNQLMLLFMRTSKERILDALSSRSTDILRMSPSSFLTISPSMIVVDLEV